MQVRKLLSPLSLSRVGATTYKVRPHNCMKHRAKLVQHQSLAQELEFAEAPQSSARCSAHSKSQFHTPDHVGIDQSLLGNVLNCDTLIQMRAGLKAVATRQPK